MRPLQLALRLAHLTWQRPGDVLRMSEADISGGVLRVQQGKTKAKLRIVIDGELKALLDDIASYKTTQMPASKVRVLSLLVNEKGDLVNVLSVRTLIRFLSEFYPAEIYNLPPDPDQVLTPPEGG